MKSSLLVTLLILISGFAFTQTIPSVKIGNQVWMTKNLNVSKFRNGDPIPEVRSKEEWVKAVENGQPGWCYYENNPANWAKYGKLYNWYAVIDIRGLCPTGWHVPSDAEWTVLTDYLGGENVAGVKMKSTSGWDNNGNGTNSSGFSGLPGGYLTDFGPFAGVDRNGCWWSSTEYYAWPRKAVGRAQPPKRLAWYRNLAHDAGSVYRNDFPTGPGMSVRCLKDL